MSRVAVVGAGTMGNGIAHVFALYGWETALLDVSRDQLARAVSAIKDNSERQVQKGAMTEDARQRLLDRISTDTSLEVAQGAELVVEAATENPAIKFGIFRDLSRICRPNTILASNTSSISINDIAEQTDRPEQVIGMHFMNPVPVMTLVEIVRGKQTAKHVVDRTDQISKSLGKTPVIVKDSPGFVSNRVLMPMINEAIFCVQDGIATAEGVDTVMKLGMKHPLGPLALADLIGLDVCLAIMEVLQEGLGDKYAPARLLKEMVASGRLGRKSGAGFYVYRD
ncbi:MAG TPA: 3-hydroxyacyl-CoA dehydrogenase NAD-binding domain-containing protein [Gemmatimonadales bacterium]